MKNYIKCRHSLYIDNFYTGLELAEELLNNDTYCTGAQNMKRRGIPQEIKKTHNCNLMRLLENTGRVF